VVSGATLLNRLVQTLFSDLDQLQSIRRHISNRHRRGGITNITFQRHSTVDREDIPILQLIRRGETVNYLFVDRRADRIRKSVIALKSWEGACVANHFLSSAIQLDRRYPNLGHFL